MWALADGTTSQENLAWLRERGTPKRKRHPQRRWVAVIVNCVGVTLSSLCRADPRAAAHAAGAVHRSARPHRRGDHRQVLRSPAALPGGTDLCYTARRANSAANDGVMDGTRRRLAAANLRRRRNFFSVIVEEVRWRAGGMDSCRGKLWRIPNRRTFPRGGRRRGGGGRLRLERCGRRGCGV